MLKSIRHATLISLFMISILFANGYRFATYNLLSFSGRDPSDLTRVDAYRTVFSELDPDILAVQEIEDQEALNVLLRDGFTYSNQKQFRATPFMDGPDTDNSLFYDKNHFLYVSQEHFSTNYRNISHFILLPIQESNPDTLHIYVMHLKAGDEWQAERKKEADLLRKQLNKHNPNDVFLVCGDMNFYTSKEAGYQALIQAGTDTAGVCFDPIAISGDWHNTSKYASIHTQSTRETGNDLFSGGGMDDRFDMILMSRVFDQENGFRYVRGSYKAFGNDGLHFNRSINFGNNRLIPPDVADALYAASDHLPVVLEFEIGDPVSVVQSSAHLENDFHILNNYPNPFNSSTTFFFTVTRPGFCSLTIVDDTGKIQQTLFSKNAAAGPHMVSWNGQDNQNRSVSSGMYIAILRQEKSVSTRKILLLK